MLNINNIAGLFLNQPKQNELTHFNDSNFDHAWNYVYHSGDSDFISISLSVKAAKVPANSKFRLGLQL